MFISYSDSDVESVPFTDRLLFQALNKLRRKVTAMTPTQLKRREALLTRNDVVLDHWPQRTGQDFICEMTAVTQGLEALAHEVDAAQGDHLERSRNWRFVGNAYFDLANNKDLRLLKLATDAYKKAEELLARIDNAIEKMKLDYSYGHALFHLSDAKDLALVNEARRRYASALEIARSEMPAGIEPAKTALRNADRVITLLTQAGGLSLRISESEKQDAAMDSETIVDMGEQFETLKLQIEAEKEKGKLDPISAQGLRETISDFQKLAGRMDSAPTIEEKDHNRAELSRMLGAMKPHIQQPTYPGASEHPQEGSRAAKVLSYINDLKVLVGQGAMLTGRSFSESDLSNNLYRRLAQLGTAVYNTQGEDAALVQLEITQARTLANEARWYMLRKNPIITEPVWGHGSEALDPNLIFLSGSESVRKTLETLADAVGLRVNPTESPGTDIAKTRWRDLSAATLAIFDISTGDPQVFYELGIALANGTEVLVVAQEGTDIPFDIAQDIRFYSGTRDFGNVLRTALDAALYGVQSKGIAGSSVESTIKYAEQRAASSTKELLRGALIALRKAERDPMAFRTAIQGFAAYLSAGADVLYTRWPGSYPAESRCFVVMPFRRELDKTYHAISRECERAAVNPIRGDVASGQEIILSIWEEICQATHVIVDLTGLNSNVCLELGIADTLGRKTLLVGRKGTEKELFPSIAKRRLNLYPTDPIHSAPFTRVLQDFLGN